MPFQSLFKNILLKKKSFYEPTEPEIEFVFIKSQRNLETLRAEIQTDLNKALSINTI